MTSEVTVETLPKCDFCDDTASYDAKAKSGIWAYMCELHWLKHRATESLGLGIGQRLVVEPVDRECGI
jgi:hypothetical protein